MCCINKVDWDFLVDLDIFAVAITLLEIIGDGQSNS
jgi:hypothetical protein